MTTGLFRYVLLKRNSTQAEEDATMDYYYIIVLLLLLLIYIRVIVFHPASDLLDSSHLTTETCMLQQCTVFIKVEENTMTNPTMKSLLLLTIIRKHRGSTYSPSHNYHHQHNEFCSQATPFGNVSVPSALMDMVGVRRAWVLLRVRERQNS